MDLVDLQSERGPAQLAAGFGYLGGRMARTTDEAIDVLRSWGAVRLSGRGRAA